MILRTRGKQYWLLGQTRFEMDTDKELQYSFYSSGMEMKYISLLLQKKEKKNCYRFNCIKSLARDNTNDRIMSVRLGFRKYN